MESWYPVLNLNTNSWTGYRPSPPAGSQKGLRRSNTFRQAHQGEIRANCVRASVLLPRGWRDTARQNRSKGLYQKAAKPKRLQRGYREK